MAENPEQAIYRITVRGYLEPSWSEWFGNLVITYEADGAKTVLCGPVPDQAALHGILIKIRDMNLPLLAITRFDETGDA